MTTVMLVALIVLPLAAAAVAASAGRRPDIAAAVGTSSSLLAFVLGVGLLALTEPWRSGTDTATLDLPWIGLLGSRLHLGWDGISAPLVLLTSLLGALACWYLWATADDAQPGRTAGRPPSPRLIAALLATQAGAVGTFLARDLLVFFIAFEAVLVPMWLIVGRWGGDPEASDPARQKAERRAAATRFVLYTALGSALMLLGLLLLATAAGGSDFRTLSSAQLPVRTQTIAALLLIVGLGVKVPIWPLHSWLPPAHTIAPTVGSVLLAGVLLKLGSYGLVRLVVGFAPAGLNTLALPLAAVGVIGILWGGLVCLVETDLKRLIAFSSVAHMGFVVLGVASNTPEGVQGALFVGVAHGVVTGLLFWVVGMLKHRHLAPRSADLRSLPAGLRDSHPRLGWMLAFGAAAGLGLPGLTGFWGEIATLLGTWSSPALGGARGWLVLAGALGTVLAAAYLLRVLYLIWHGQAPVVESDGPSAQQTPAPATLAADADGSVEGAAGSVAGTAAGSVQTDLHAPDLPEIVTGTDLTVPEQSVLVPLVAAALAFGVQPWLLFSLTGPAVRTMMGVG